VDTKPAYRNVLKRAVVDLLETPGVGSVGISWMDPYLGTRQQIVVLLDDVGRAGWNDVEPDIVETEIELAMEVNDAPNDKPDSLSAAFDRWRVLHGKPNFTGKLQPAPDLERHRSADGQLFLNGKVHVQGDAWVRGFAKANGIK
jgi:hypothetical protein